MNFTEEYEHRCAEWSDIVDHLPRLHREASKPGVKIIELGVRSGNSTAAFLAAVEERIGHLWSVDITRPHVPPDWFNCPRWTVLIGDDLDLVDQLPDGVDIVFIDTSHRYDQTLAELRAYQSKVKPGGVIICHDTELAHPDAETQGDPAFPVALALGEWAAENGLTVEWVEGCYGLGVVHVG